MDGQESTNATEMSNGLKRQVENNKRKLADYNLVRIIGTGTFGKVYFAIINGKGYALKMLHKRKIIQLKQIDHINNEKNILASIVHPFIVNLVESF